MGSEDLAANHDVMQIVEVLLLLEVNLDSSKSRNKDPNTDEALQYLVLIYRFQF